MPTTPDNKREEMMKDVGQKRDQKSFQDANKRELSKCMKRVCISTLTSFSPSYPPTTKKMNKEEIKKEFEKEFGYNIGNNGDHETNSIYIDEVVGFFLSKLDAYQSSLLERTTQWRDYFDDVEVDAKVLGGKIWKEKPEWLGMIQGIESVAGMAKYSVDKFINLIKEERE